MTEQLFSVVVMAGYNRAQSTGEAFDSARQELLSCKLTRRTTGNLNLTEAEFLSDWRDEMRHRQVMRYFRCTSSNFCLMHNEVGQEIPSPLCGETVRVRLPYESEFDGRQRDVDVAFNMRNNTGMVLTAFANIQSGQPRLAVHRRGWFECLWPRTNLRGSEYDCALFCAVDGDTCDWMQSAFTMSIEDADFYGTGNLVSRNHGDVLCEHEWSSAKQDAECLAETK